MITRNRFIFAANTDSGGGTIAAADSPTGQAIETTPQAAPPAPEIIQEAPQETGKIGKPGVRISKVDVARELGLSEAPSKTVERMVKTQQDKITGRFRKGPAKPVVKITQQVPPAPKPAKPATSDTATVPLGEPEPTPEPVPEPEPKIKLLGQEKTATEWEQHFAELEKAKEKQPDNPKPEAVKTSEDEAAAERDAEEQFINAASERFTPTQEEFDRMLADGDTKGFGRMMAKVAMDTRKWMAQQINPHLDRLAGQLTPLAQQQEQIAQYQAESQFLEANPAIKNNPKGLHAMRETSAELHAEHDDLIQFLAVNPSSVNATRYRERAKVLETDFLGELAKATTAKLGAAPAPTQPVALTPPLPMQPSKPRPPAQTGNMSAATGAGAKNGSAGISAEIAQMRARGLM